MLSRQVIVEAATATHDLKSQKRLTQCSSIKETGQYHMRSASSRFIIIAGTISPVPDSAHNQPISNELNAYGMYIAPASSRFCLTSSGNCKVKTN